MATTATRPGFSVRRAEDAPTVPCPCGQSTRIVSAGDGLGCSLHVTEIRDSVRHYHRGFTEIYYVLEGTGRMVLGDESVVVGPGTVITIQPGTRHRLVSEHGVRTIVFSVPAFDPNDEQFD